jgi:Uncharacterised nucleotidyltransferase
VSFADVGSQFIREHPQEQSSRLFRRDLAQARLPAYGRVLIQLLSFSEQLANPIGRLSDEDWDELLRLTDAMQLTLVLGHFSHHHLPTWVQERIARNYSDNMQRFARVTKQTQEICSALSAAHIEFAVLKGHTHVPHFTPDPVLRSQGDIDIWCQPQSVVPAQAVLRELGYRAIAKSTNRHLDPMIRETKWNWTGDYYAPDLPIPVDLHYQLWDESMEGIQGPSETDIWSRRCRAYSTVAPLLSYLDIADSFTFACLHALMHLLHGDLRLQRTWELAFFMQQYSECDEFWFRWQSLYPPEARQVLIIPLALSSGWFGCPLPELIREEIEALPQNVLVWLKYYWLSPLESMFQSNKHELWLNIALLSSVRSKASVFMRRLLPLNAAAMQQKSPGRGDTPQPTITSLNFLLSRAWHHTTTFPLTCWEGLVWLRRCQADKKRGQQVENFR